MELDRVARASRPSGCGRFDADSLGRDAQATLASAPSATRSPRARLSRIAILLLAALPWPAAFAYLAHFERHVMRVRGYWAANPGAVRSGTSMNMLYGEARAVCCMLMPVAMVVAFWIREARTGPFSMPRALAAVPFSPHRHLARRMGACALGACASFLPTYLVLERPDGEEGLMGVVYAMLPIALCALPVPILLAANRQTTHGQRVAAAAVLAAQAWAILLVATAFGSWGIPGMRDLHLLLTSVYPDLFPPFLRVAILAILPLAGLPWAWRAWSRMFREDAP